MLVQPTDGCPRDANRRAEVAPGVRLTLRMVDKRGELARLESVFYEKGWEIKNVSGAPDPKDSGKFMAVLRFDPQVVKEDVREAVNQVEGFEITDIRDGS